MKKQPKLGTGESTVFLRGNKTILRPVSEDDIPLYLKWFNDPEVRQYITTIFPMTRDAEKEWVEGLKKRTETDVVLMIEVKGKTIGMLGLHRINWQDRTATTGAVIGEKDYWGKGYGTDAKMALLEYAFNTLNLRKILSNVIEFNKRSVAYSLKCGYVVEGKLRKQHYKKGEYWDQVILGVFKEEWLAAWKQYQKKRGESKSK